MQRQVSSWPNRAKAAKLFSHQADAVRRNGLLVDLRANKVRGVVERTAKAVAAEDQPSTRAGINALSGLNAVAATHGKSGNELLHALQDLSRKRPTDVGLALTLVQTHLDRGSAGAALSTFEAFLGRLEQPAEDCSAAPRHALDTRFSPGIVALAASLMRSQGRHSSSKTELSKAVRYWQQERPASVSESSETESTSWARPLLQEAGIELLRSSNPRDLKLAGSAFEKLFSESQGSHIAAAGLVASLAPFDLEKADEYVAELPEVDDLIDDVDVDALLDAGVATYISPAAQAAGAKRAAADDDARTSKTAAGPAKKRRTRKLPKNYVEGRTPDPERWLPLRDRSSYRPKGRKGKKKAAESTQGGPVRDEETLGLVGGGGVKVEKAGGNANKKKKKGKK